MFVSVHTLSLAELKALCDKKESEYEEAQRIVEEDPYLRNDHHTRNVLKSRGKPQKDSNSVTDILSFVKIRKEYLYDKYNQNEVKPHDCNAMATHSRSTRAAS